MEEFDHIVIGAGVEGSATALHLVKHMKKTLLLEQFNLPHTRGSSHGQSRIIRYSYPEDFYAKMMPYAYDQWFELEKLTKTKLLKQVGLLTVSEPPSQVVSETMNSLKSLNIPCEHLTSQQLRLKYPMLRLSDNHEGVFEGTGGVLKADKCVNSLQKVYQQYGGVLRDNEKVVEIRPSGAAGPVTVVSRAGGAGAATTHYRALVSVVICAGAWANSLLSPLHLQLPLQLSALKTCYWREVGEAAVLPCACRIMSGDTHVYIVPQGEYPGLIKVCYHSGVEITDPDHRDQGASLESYDVEKIRQFIKDSLPGLQHHQPAIVEHCMYTNTPDSHPVLDRHPQYSNVIIGAGFSGHGFKLAPSVGKVLSELALGRSPTFNIRPFSVHRFTTHKANRAKY